MKSIPRHITIKILKNKYKERPLKTAREKEHSTYRGTPMCMTVNQ